MEIDLIQLIHQVELETLCVKNFKEKDTMKLFLCRKCQDVVRCFEEERKCKCGECTGKYLGNGLDAVFSGENCVPIGMDGNGIVKAIKMADIENKYQIEPTTCKGVDFKTFVILDCATTITKI